MEIPYHHRGLREQQGNRDKETVKTSTVGLPGLPALPAVDGR